MRNGQCDRGDAEAAAGETLALADSQDGVVSGLAANTLRVRAALPGDLNLDGIWNGRYGWNGNAVERQARMLATSYPMHFIDSPFQ